jgi:sugar/nucleoside kinase (ribokinase family)
VSGGDTFQSGGATGISEGPKAGTSAAVNWGNTASAGVHDDFMVQVVQQPGTMSARPKAAAVRARLVKRCFEMMGIFMGGK